MNFDFNNQTITINKITFTHDDKIILSNDTNPENFEQRVTSLIAKYKIPSSSIHPLISDQFKIPLISDKVASLLPYPVKPTDLDDLKYHLNELKSLEIIQPSHSMFASPSFTKRKKDGKLRLLIDYRELNANSTALEYYFPSISDTFFKLKGSNIFSQIELEQGFYQIEISDTDRHKTAFTTPFGKFEYNRVPFGLRNAPKFFNAVISQILMDNPNVIVFIDDILIFSHSEQEHTSKSPRITS
ncbi:transposable element [Pseudoloma neurophilia]|uniref:Transposable element n=1 Tax=Pseudoloma neurophilia TaxID=146866 RepID=A0A0R0LSP4_9MICR|nr:transposable element [Pseudoloma neurophilia]